MIKTSTAVKFFVIALLLVNMVLFASFEAHQKRAVSHTFESVPPLNRYVESCPMPPQPRGARI